MQTTVSLKFYSSFIDTREGRAFEEIEFERGVRYKRSVDQNIRERGFHLSSRDARERYQKVKNTTFYGSHTVTSQLNQQLTFGSFDFQALPRTIVARPKEQMAEERHEASHIQRSHFHSETHAWVSDYGTEKSRVMLQ